MSQKDPKRPGSRDISELKARLGLKKPGAAGAAGPMSGGAAGKPNGGGVVPPPGLNLPPPPGAKPPGPVIPNAADDPFGAMNAIASYGQQQRAPEIVIVNDGKPVESVSGGKRAVKILTYAAPAIATLIIGWVIASNRKDSQNASEGKDSAAGMAKLVDADLKALGPIKSAFEATGPSQKELDDLTAQLAAAKDKLLDRKPIAMKLKTDFIGADLRATVTTFYSDLDEINDMITDHLATAQLEGAAIKTGADQVAKLAIKQGDTLQQGGAPYKLGIMMSQPANDTDKGPQEMHVVEIGAPLCGSDLKSAQPATGGACPDGAGVPGFLYRENGTDVAWSKGKLNPARSIDPAKPFPADTIVLIGATQTLDSLVKTPDATYAEAAYRNRLDALRKKVKQAYDLGETLEKALNDKSR